MKNYEWTDEIKALQDSLSALNLVLLETADLEETARDEAINVKRLLDIGDWTKAELIDRVTQASIDVLSNRRKGA